MNERKKVQKAIKQALKQIKGNGAKYKHRHHHPKPARGIIILCVLRKLC